MQGRSNTSLSERYAIVEDEHSEALALCCLVLISKEMPSLAQYILWITDEERSHRSSVPE